MTKIRKKKKTYFPRHFYTIFEEKCSNLRPLLSITFPQGFQIPKIFGQWTSRSLGKRPVKRSEQMRRKKSVKNFFCRGNCTQFLAKNFKSETISFHYFSPRTPNIYKAWTLDVGKWGQKDR